MPKRAWELSSSFSILKQLNLHPHLCFITSHLSTQQVIPCMSPLFNPHIHIVNYARGKRQHRCPKAASAFPCLPSRFTELLQAPHDQLSLLCSLSQLAQFRA